jgi:hypothetical protein
MSDYNPFLNKTFIKDIKRSFIPIQIFKKNKYNYDIIDVNFKYKKNNIVQINIKLTNGKKYEYMYILDNNFIKELNNEDTNMDLLDIKFEKMSID